MSDVIRSDRFARAARRALLAAAALAGACALSPPARAQAMDPDQERARQLVLRIRKSMREIDSLLLKGAQPEKIERELAENVKRLEELLLETESKSQSVIQNLDELVKLAKYRKSQSSGGGGSDQDQQPRERSGRMPQREKSQEPGELSPQPGPGQQGEGEQPQDEQPQPQGQEKGDGDPKSGRPDRTPPDQRDAKRPPPQAPTGEFERPDTAGRWGMLPPKEAEDLQRRDVDEFPQRYRQWMELYFRRVNRLPSRD
jgi:hypothetical protein